MDGPADRRASEAGSDPRHWQQVRALFEQAIDEPPAERGAFLDAACDDPALRAAVDELLAADAAADDRAGAWTPAWFGARLDELLAGVQIGEFRLVRLLAAGGMGAVYEAAQQTPPRHVALKMLRPGLLSDAALARFQDEVATLARLQHPGIAQIHAAGIHRDVVGERAVEVPYFAMELVRDARTIVAHARERALEPAARIWLFLACCDAVQYGHGRGVLHRDLKAANILVSGEGRVVVIDFGIATPLAVDGGPTVAQRSGSAGTLRAMSPEQLRGDADLDVRSDVYALGIVLYDLLDDDSLPAELRWILDRALAADREDRYATVAAFADDLRRLLRHEPVAAAPPGWRYRARKFARRHRVVVGAGLLLVLSIAAGTTVAAAGWLEARAQRAAAEARAREAEEVVRFFRETMLAAMPWHDGPDATIGEVLQAAGDRIDDELGHLPEAARVLHHSLGETLQSLGSLEPAAVHLRRALELARGPAPLSAEEHVKLALDLVEVLRELRADEEQLALLERTRDFAKRELGPDAVMTLATRSAMGTLLARLGRGDEAVALLRALRERSSEVRGRTHRETLAMTNNLLVVLQRIGRPQEAAAVGESLVEDMERVFGPDHRHTWTARANVAAIRTGLGEFARAEPQLREALERRVATFGEQHLDVARNRYWLGRALLGLDRPDEAREQLERALAILGAQLGGDHVLVRTTRLSLARALVETGHPAAALEQLGPLLEASGGDRALQRQAAALRDRARQALDQKQR